MLAFEDDRNRAAGKVRMIVKLTNTAINDYDTNNSPDDMDGLGMGGVSVGGGLNYINNNNNNANQSVVSSRLRNTVAMNNTNTNTGSTMNGAMPAGAAGRGGVSYGRDFDYLLQSQIEDSNELTNSPMLYLMLTGVAVVDLRSVHTFAPNSPSVNLACGKVVATTAVRLLFYHTNKFAILQQIITLHFSFPKTTLIVYQAAENAGKMANWENLNIIMPMDKSATLRVLISSRDKVIGQCTMTRDKLLGGRKNPQNCYVVSRNFILFVHVPELVQTFSHVLIACLLLFFIQLFGELDNNEKAAGKIKFVYTLDDKM